MRLTRSWVVVAAAAILAVPLATSPSLASWTDEEWAHAAAIGTDTLRCGTATGFETAASGRQVSGTLLGMDLDTIAAVNGVSNSIDGTPTESFAPAGSAHDLDPGDTSTFTRATSLNVGVLPAPLATVALPTVQLPVPDFELGALAQYSQVKTTGVATAATGAVGNESGIATIGNYDSSAPPTNGSISLKSVLGSAITSNIADASLNLGAVSALSQVDGCDILRETTWNIPAASTSINRDYDIANLDMTIDAPILSGLVAQVDTSVTDLQGRLDGLQQALLSGISGVLNQITVDLAILSVSTSGTSISVTNIPNVAGTVSSLLDGISDADGIVTLSPRAGLVKVDLAKLLNGTNGLNSLNPNTQFLLTPEVLSDIGTRVTNLVTSWRTQVISALTAATNATQVSVNVAASVRALGLVTVANIGINLNANLGALFANNGALISAGVSVNLLNLDSPLLAGVLGSVLGVLNPLQGLLVAVIRDLVNNIFAVITSLDGVLAAAVPVVANAVALVFSTLAPILRIYVNVQPDQPGAPTNSSYIPATPTSTAEYTVTALHIELIGTTSLNVATASAGPVSLP